MEDIKIISTTKASSSQYIQPMRVKYKQAGMEKTWDYMKVHNSVAILIVNVTSQQVVLVRQFRPAVYMAQLAMAKESGNQDQIPASTAVTYELCAGIVDRKDRIENIACSEVLEETGYKISPDMLEPIAKFRSGVGVSGSLQQMFYVEVTDKMKVSAGGGNEAEGEFIELFHLKLDDIQSFLEDQTLTNRPAGLLYAFSWFISKKLNKFKK